jgi:hypothetical protein
MTLQESVETLKSCYDGMPPNSIIKESVRVILDAVERSIDIEQWDAEESQIEEICNRCNGQGCSKCSR